MSIKNISELMSIKKQIETNVDRKTNRNLCRIKSELLSKVIAFKY